MGGGLMQLVAYGAQDIYLTGNPQITFFKVVYRRHTNFSMEAIEQTWNGTSTGNGRCTATISRNGDLVHRMSIEIQAGTTSWLAAANPGANFVNDITLEIGGQQIDKHTGQWMETWAELTVPNPSGTVASGVAPDALTAHATLFQITTGYGGVSAAQRTTTNDIILVPLQFWFCRNPGLALPLIALQYHEVKVILDHQINTVLAANATHMKLWAEYIYLDTDERRRFAQVSHEYLIEQVQHLTTSASNTSNDLNFNHPVKELVWTGAWSTGENTAAPGTVKTWQIKLNGHDRMAARNYRHFTREQVLNYHSGAGGLDCSTNNTGGASQWDDSIAVYSFALKPEEHQPSGTCNFSRIDNAQLVSTGGTPDALDVFAVNYNVLRIMSGMGGLAYSN